MNPLLKHAQGWTKEQVNAHNAGIYRQTRKSLGATCSQLAEILGVSRDMISNRENGRTEITPEMMLALEMVVLLHTPAEATLSELGVSQETADKILAEVGGGAKIAASGLAVAS
jgi:DNA-binding XRE family transcriptional regulator